MDQASERIQIPFVQRIRCNWAGRLAFALRCFQQHRQVAKPAVVDDPPKRLESEKPLADVLVTIHTAAERPLRVVQMKGFQPVEADETAELLECRGVAFWRAQIVPRREQVTRVQTDAGAAV